VKLNELHEHLWVERDSSTVFKEGKPSKLNTLAGESSEEKKKKKKNTHAKKPSA
jgi:hypothetical protein